MTDPLSPPGPEPSEERVKARGRGLGILMVIRPSITKKDIHPIRQSMERALSDSFASVELSYFPRDPTSTHLKIVADLAKFRLSPADVVPWYSRLLERFLLQFQQDLKELHHSIEDVQVAFLTRYSPREKEGDLIPVPTTEETSALQPDLARILAPPISPSPTEPDEAARITGTPSTDTFTPEIYPNSPFLLYILSTLLIAQKKDREALSILDHLITVYPDCAEAYLQRSKVRFRLGDSSGSEQDRAKARELNPDLVVGQ
jgi:tetratricopeptide (TPR) repeat protein